MRTRLATADDFDAITAITNEAIADTVSHFSYTPDDPDETRQRWLATRDRHPWFIAVDEHNEVLGHARSYDFNTREGYRWSCEVGVYVASRARGKRVGRRLYDALIPELEHRGFRVLLARIALPNPASVRLHESVGFRLAGTFERIGYKHGAWHDTGLFTCHLGEGPPNHASAAAGDL